MRVLATPGVLTHRSTSAHTANPGGPDDGTALHREPAGTATTTPTDAEIIDRSRLAGAPGGLSAEDRDVLLLVAWEQPEPAASGTSRGAGPVVVPDARDGVGRRGLGITLPMPPGSMGEPRDRALVFAPDTFELLGFGRSAITALTIVDQPKQRP